MDSLKLMEALNEAIRILNKARREASTGSVTIWRMIDHASNHLDLQLAEMLAA